MTFQDRSICDIEWEGKGVDSFFTNATWEDDLTALSDSELDDLTDSDEGQDYLCRENMESFGWYRK